MTDTLNFIIQKFPLLLEKLFEQIYLSLTGILLAIAISIPLGIVVARKDKAQNFFFILTNTIQTLPSLAILGFLLPFFGIGVKTAIITLVIYSVLPILRNTVTSIINIPKELIEAADSLGLTKFQKIWRIELPLALPVIVAGIRTAAAMSIGITTLAAFIGAGGLGDFIYEGLSLNNVPLILLGSIPAAMLALLLDYLISIVEKSLTNRKRKNNIKRTDILWLLPCAILASMLVIFSFYLLHSSEHKVIIGTKNFTEQLILGEILAQTLEKKTSLTVERKFNLGSTYICHRALIDGQIDVYPEYTGTSYRVILKASGLSDPFAIFNFVKSAYLRNYAVVWLGIFGFNNSNAVAIRKEYAEKNKIFTITDLTPLASQLIWGIPPDFLERPDGFKGLTTKYHLNFKKVRLMDPGLMYEAIHHKKIDVIMAFSTDARLAEYQLVTLKDDKHLFPPYFAAPIIRNKKLKRFPEIATALSSLNGKITDSVMRALNYQVDVLKKSPEEVARAFLRSM